MAAAVAVGGCAYSGPTDNAIAQSLTWFSYLDAGDLRRGCVPGGGERYRIAHNGNYSEQIRAYDVTAAAGGGGQMTARVRGATGRLNDFEIGDPLRSWRGEQRQVALSPADMAALRAALDSSGAFQPAPVGLRLNSKAFYWIVAGCRDGRFSYHAWEWPSPGYDRLTFPQFLASRDGSGIALRPPQPRQPDFPISQDSRTERQEFQLRVGENGLVNLTTLF